MDSATVTAVLFLLGVVLLAVAIERIIGGRDE